MKLPIPVIDSIEGFQVVRDDLLPGGTKMRYILPLLEAHPEVEEFVYGSPAFGYAQIALAHCAKMLGKRATIFTALRVPMHERTMRAKGAGAKIMCVNPGYMTVVNKRARDYCALTGAKLLPFGVEDEVAISAFVEEVKKMKEPREVWTCAGSGTLTRALQRAWPNAQFFAVKVGGECNVGRARLYVAPEKFEQNAKEKPPFPSCSNYDAKVWRFMREYGRAGALFWNVGA
jgi:hypothetical protein